MPSHRRAQRRQLLTGRRAAAAAAIVSAVSTVAAALAGTRSAATSVAADDVEPAATSWPAVATPTVTTTPDAVPPAPATSSRVPAAAPAPAPAPTPAPRPPARTSPARPPPPAAAPSVSGPGPGTVQQRVHAAALGYVGRGIPYVYGGKSLAGLDCSGLVWLALHDAGLPVPYRPSGALAAWTTPIPAASAVPGDLVFWPGHVGIVAGAGQVIDQGGPGSGANLRPIWPGARYGRIPTT